MKPDPTHATSRRSGKKLTQHEQAQFLEALASTGNFAYACQLIGRVKSGLYKRRARDPVFAAHCAAALATFHAANPISPSPQAGSGHQPRFLSEAERLPEGLGRGGGNTDNQSWRRTSNQPPKSTPGSLTFLPATAKRPPQLRRAKPGSLTQAGLDQFLLALSMTGNVRLAAESIGCAASSIHRRRKTDPQFSRRFNQAMEVARQSLQLLILDHCDRTFDADYRTELAEAGELPDVEQITPTQALQYLWWTDRKGRR